ncbi:bifunctional phosphoribosylaminoimidazolecarboxamide formyltransferase/IMP cyclohydrolase [Oceanithermus sp.]|uniref:bifunctional phosphoribosylaminoimidazolecarboxamide formyltransferase/IMP cyclohydrolase n=1 Tax=Oceanithermus sp. TaxID=2268145 RepID=UPI0025FDD919|nr:bifunctional phosphoribosylaminoimidazolecarboxamide formyltransferase/IMP cyclohydrolase [Oceanithermus sp.]
MRALLSVSDKRGLVEFARGLAELGFELVSTGGTARALEEAGLVVTPVERVTGFPEVLGGRVKTLHPRVHAGVLARADQLGELEALGVEPFDLVAVNLYPFESAVAGGADERAALEQIDIGGPTLLRAAAKNHPRVWAVARPEDYPEVLRALAEESPEAQRRLRERLAARAFAHTAAYDAAIAAWFAERLEGRFPERRLLVLERRASLRYGENPHQEAALYAVRGETGPLLEARQLQGKPMSFNNYGDAEAAWNLVSAYDEPAAVAVKHQNPCGVAVAPTLAEAFQKAHDADPVSIFGGIVALNRPVDVATAEKLAPLFLEVLLAPGYAPEALELLARKKNLRVLEVPTFASGDYLDLRRIRGGVLVQDADVAPLDLSRAEVVTRRAPTEAEWADLRFAWPVVRALRSNAIAVARDGQTLGAGMGQTSRIEAARHALDQAGEAARGAVLASDAFFPFDDVVRLAAERGVRAIVQPGGSKRDADSIAAADEAGIAMVFTHQRVFRH